MDRLHDIQLLIMYDADDWKPQDGVKTAHSTSDPTAQKAIYNVDELGEKLTALRQEERELQNFIGESLVIISAVRSELGDKYADVLESRYIDGEKWQDIADRFESNHENRDSVNHRTVQNWAQVAFDWIDSVGVSNLLRGQTEL